MLELLRRLVTAGLGTIQLKQEEVRAVFDELVRRGEITEQDARELLSEWTSKAADQSSKLEARVNEIVRKGIERLNLAPRAEVEVLQGRIKDLEARLAEREGVGPARGA